MNDQAVVVVQLGRSLRSDIKVVTRCHLELPVVVTVPPILDDGTPFPTRYWLTCPLAAKRVGRLESIGGVKQMERRLDHDPVLAEQLAARHVSYAAERDAEIPDETVHRPSGGVAGLGVGVKCLHAHYGDWAAGHSNPVGRIVADWVEPLDCQQRCVVPSDRGMIGNSKWQEPK